MFSVTAQGDCCGGVFVAGPGARLPDEAGCSAVDHHTCGVSALLAL